MVEMTLWQPWLFARLSILNPHNNNIQTCLLYSQKIRKFYFSPAEAFTVGLYIQWKLIDYPLKSIRHCLSSSRKVSFTSSLNDWEFSRKSRTISGVICCYSIHCSRSPDSFGHGLWYRGDYFQQVGWVGGAGMPFWWIEQYGLWGIRAYPIVSVLFFSDFSLITSIGMIRRRIKAAVLHLASLCEFARPLISLR